MKEVITRYCIIRNRTVVINGKDVFHRVSGTLNDFLNEAYAFFKIDYPKFYKMDNLSKLGFLAAEVMLRNGDLRAEYQSESIALVLSNAHASIDTDRRYLETTKTLASPALFVYTLPNIVAGEICIRHNIKGENAFFISPAYDAVLMADYASMILSPPSGAKITNACLAGWIDVIGEHHDVFLYLLEKNKQGLHHTADELEKCYTTTLWNN